MRLSCGNDVTLKYMLNYSASSPQNQLTKKSILYQQRNAEQELDNQTSLRDIRQVSRGRMNPILLERNYKSALFSPEQIQAGTNILHDNNSNDKHTEEVFQHSLPSKGKHQFLTACKIFHHGIEESELHLILESYATMTVLQQKSSLTKQQAIPIVLNSNFQKSLCVEKKMSHLNSLPGIILGLF